MKPSIQKTLEEVGLDALIRESRTISPARRFELQQQYATGGPNFDMGQFAGLALALRRVEAGAPVEELRELVLAMAEQAFYCRQVLEKEADPKFWAEMNAEIAEIESGRTTTHDFKAVLDEFRREREAASHRTSNGTHGEPKGQSAGASEK